MDIPNNWKTWIGVTALAVILVTLAWWWQRSRVLTLEVWRPETACPEDTFTPTLDEQIASIQAHTSGLPVGVAAEYLTLQARHNGQTLLTLTMPACENTGAPPFSWVYQLDVHPLSGLHAMLVTDDRQTDSPDAAVSTYWDIDLRSREIASYSPTVWRWADVADSENLDAQMAGYLPALEDFLRQVFPEQAVVITDWSQGARVDGQRVFHLTMQQYKDGVVNDSSRLELDFDPNTHWVDAPTAAIEGMYLGMYPPVAVTPEQVSDTVLSWAQTREHELFPEATAGRRFTGEYVIVGDNAGGVYYYVSVNGRMYVLVNALSGQIEKEGDISS